ncbi:hypothetical protein AA12717_1941 [Gluconacetobacter sacchari DSM 12717]|uniref:DUF4175 family protein n=2 Tax=Gluconacetobacter sacchari TaxID=92759 RepID=A0A7W4IFR8_9PROT|nr:DUF4175 family protein [Gluconacetobacter sacchari]MBB2162038.1 DUF4175 family protein [Gluconacetobacter sacchari]GBQ24969.1 hypothetical protein AA12717_1941 [Gluconacetobacter sacchari DSM 12717]
MAGGSSTLRDGRVSAGAVVPFAVRLAAARHRARLVLWVEAARPVLLPVLGGLTAYLIAGLLGGPQALPDLLRGVVLVGLAGAGVGWVVWRGRRVAAPTADAIDRRIERASGMAHRPLQTLADHPAAGGAEQAGLWAAHLWRTGHAIGRMRAGWPRVWSGAADPWRLGIVLPLALLAALGWAGPEAPGRLAAAFWPGLDDPGAPRPHIQAWITPPAYAPGAPVFLDERAGRATVPRGAVLSVSITDLRGRPSLRVAGAGAGPAVGDERVRALGPGSWSAEVTLLDSASLALRGRGRTFSDWTVTVLPDMAPVVAWGVRPGAPDGEWRTRLPYAAKQAYGIASLHAELRLAPGKGVLPGRVLSVPIPLDGRPRDAEGVAMPDLSADPWAGEMVVGRLVATSASGQEGSSPEVRFRLGARKFTSPVAKAVLDIRRRLALGREGAADGAADLAALGEMPDPFQADAGMLLNLASAADLLESPDVAPQAALDQVVARLWYLALEIEDVRHGGQAGAQAALEVRAAQDAVTAQLNRMRALGAQGQSPAEQSELQRRMEALRQAISRRMQALAQQALQSHTAIPDLPGMTQDGDRALSKMMQQMQDAAKEGRSADAMRMMQHMEDMLEHMRTASPQDLANLAAQMMARQQAAEQQAALQDLIGRQSGLLDHSQGRLDRAQRAREKAEAERRARQEEEAPDTDNDLATMPAAELMRRLGLRPLPGMQDGQSGGAPPARSGAPAGASTGGANTPSPAGGAPGDEAARGDDRAVQRALGRALEELGHEFKGLTGKDAPSGFADAGRAIRDARAALAGGDDSAAAAAQRKALADLQKGDQQMRQAMKGSGGGGMTSFLPGFSNSSGGGKPGEGDDSGESAREGQKGDRDPLGRQTGEGKEGMDADTHVPDAVSRERAREIEQELRRRDSDRTRPREELDYLDRLLKTF